MYNHTCGERMSDCQVSVHVRKCTHTHVTQQMRSITTCTSPRPIRYYRPLLSSAVEQYGHRLVPSSPSVATVVVRSQILVI